jgi:hypothetical protein
LITVVPPTHIPWLEVAGDLQRAVAVERAQHLDFVLAEVGRVDVVAALEDQDPVAVLGEPVADHGSGRARSDDHDLGVEVARESAAVLDLQAARLLALRPQALGTP